MDTKGERDYKRKQWQLLPVILFLIILCIGTIVTAEEDSEPETVEMEDAENINSSVSDEKEEAKGGPAPDKAMKSGMSEADTITELYVDETKALNGTGTLEEPFNNMEDALEKAQTNTTIWLMETVVDIFDGMGVIIRRTWSIDLQEKSGVVIKRHKNLTGNMIESSRNTYTISNLIFDGNSEEVEAEGSIIYSEMGSLALNNVVLRNNKGVANTTNINGGAINIDYSDVEMKDCEISDNYAYYGGGIFVTESVSGTYGGRNVDVSNTKFHNNEAVVGGGGIHCNGRMKLIINGGEISNNTAGVEGGGLMTLSPSNAQNGVYIYAASVNGTKIIGNHAKNGGGVSTNYYIGYFESVTFTNNTASKAYFWTLDPSDTTGVSSLHSTYIKDCTYSQGPINEEETIFADFTNAYNGYDIKYTSLYGLQEEINISKNISSGGTQGVAALGEELTYGVSYEVKNFEGILNAVYVKDILPDGVELVSCSGASIFLDRDENVTTSMANAKYIKWELGDLKSAVSGTFTVRVKVLDAAAGKTIINKAGIIAEKEYKEVWDEAGIEVERGEVIEFTVPDKFDYGTAKIEPKKQYFGLDWQDSADEKTGENMIAVEDTRQNMGADWKLYAQLSGKVADQNGTGSNILNDVLVYCEEGTETTLSNSNILIAEKSGYSSDYIWISKDWYEDYKETGNYPTDGSNAKGLYMVVQPGQGSINDGGSYKGEITWILSYTP